MPATGLQKYTGTPEDQARATETYLYGLQGLPLGAASNVIPPVIAGADPSDWKSYVPGLGSYLYGGITGLAAKAINTVLPYAAMSEPATDLPTMTDPHATEPAATPDIVLPGHDAAMKMNEDAVNAALKILPHAEATTEAAKTGQDIGISMGQGTTAILPEVAANAPFVGPVLKTVVPPASTAGVGAALGGTAGAFASPTGSDSPFTPVDLNAPADTRQVYTSCECRANPYQPVDLNQPVVPVTPDTPTNCLQCVLCILLPHQTMTQAFHTGSMEQEVLHRLHYLWGIAKYGPGGVNTIADVLRGQSQ